MASPAAGTRYKFPLVVDEIPVDQTCGAVVKPVQAASHEVLDNGLSAEEIQETGLKEEDSE
ncbi:hypothetical protein LLEC1_04962 [Akanthomyces lecanii]|uniref:Uncharacterized protein n=1 Tax=Cordyceps confragosa TaxID=2714763 RepID=A0A179I7P2_CORDF|nr:hypothetical protein LLEC1_04962 [Akanthomyces lecanii]